MSNADITAHTRLSFETFLRDWEEEKRERELEDEREWQQLIAQWDREDEEFLREMEEDEKQLEWEKGLEVPPSL